MKNSPKTNVVTRVVVLFAFLACVDEAPRVVRVRTKPRFLSIRHDLEWKTQRGA